MSIFIAIKDCKLLKSAHRVLRNRKTIDEYVESANFTEQDKYQLNLKCIEFRYTEAYKYFFSDMTHLIYFNLL